MARGKAAGKQRHTPRRRGQEEEASSSSAWLTTYADAVTLLLAFFVMLFAMSSTDAEKFEQMARSLRAAIVGTDGALPAGTGLVGEGTADTPPDPVTPPVVPELVPPAPAPAPEREADPDEAFEGAEDLADRIHRDLQDQGLLDIAAVEATGEGVTVRVRTDEVLFATGSVEVRPVARTVLTALAPSLHSIANPLRIEGHTDDVPIGSADYTNWNLSVDRAVAVLSLLVDDHGLDPTRMSAVGFGEHAPLVPNTSPANRRTNRRVEIIIEASSDEADRVAGSTSRAPSSSGGSP